MFLLQALFTPRSRIEYFRDTYYDTLDFEWTFAGHWVRMRDSILGTNSAASSWTLKSALPTRMPVVYEEIKDMAKIQERLNLSKPPADCGLVAPFAKYSVVRIYMDTNDERLIYVDAVQFDKDSHYLLLTLCPPSSDQPAVPRPFLGNSKVMEFLYRKNPDLHEALTCETVGGPFVLSSSSASALDPHMREVVLKIENDLGVQLKREFDRILERLPNCDSPPQYDLIDPFAAARHLAPHHDWNDETLPDVN